MFAIDMKSRTPIYKQIEENIIKLITTGALRPNDQLPSVRSLAQEIKINPNTVQKAYTSLEQKNLVYMVLGRGMFVTDENNYIRSMQKTMKEKLASLSLEAKNIGISLEEQQKIISETYRRE